MWLWDSRTHQKIASLALQKCDKTFVNLMKVHQEFFILGIEAPDRIFKDITNHYYNCTPNAYGIHHGKIIQKIEKEIILIESMLQNLDKIILHDNIAPFLSALLNTPLKAFIFELGVLSHYIADLHQPMHTDGKYRFADEETVHKILEADTRIHLEELQFISHRRQSIDDPLGFFTFQIFEINGFYDDLIDRYYLKKGKVKPDRWINSKEIIETCLSTAAMNIANAFLGFEKKVRYFKPAANNARLLKKLNSKIRNDRAYRLIEYPSGTISMKYKKTIIIK
jgi:Zinc dependent phospholipase C